MSNDEALIPGGGLGIAPLSAEDLSQIHDATLAVLERTGIRVETDAARAVFGDGHCVVDDESRTVRIPPSVVSAAIDSAPPSFVLHGRVSERDVVVSEESAIYSNFGEAPMIADLQTGESRPSTKNDSADIARLCDWASEVGLYESAVAPTDCRTSVPQAHVYETSLHHTTKPQLMAPITAHDTEACIDIAAAVADGPENVRERPPLCIGACTLSPLQLTHEFTDIVLTSARAGVPTCVWTMAMAGATGPQTLAGTLVMDNAELLAGIVLTQLVEPGLPVWYGASTLALDLRLGAASVGTPEAALLNACIVQLARRYGIPSFVAGL
jgi:trimethylamine--corrinoid protein Co-methyltransferase